MEEFKKVTALDSFFEKSYGWAVFPKVGKFAFIVGMGGAGGEVYVKKDGAPEKVGVATLMMASGGWSLGLTVYKEIIFFENKEAFEMFAKGNFEFQAGAKCHVLDFGDDSAARTTGGSDMNKVKDEYYQGMMTFVLPTMGAMIDVSAEGQKFSYSPMAEH